MKRFLFYTSIVCALVFFVACEKEQEPELGSIYGVVTDLATGNPVQSANVQLQPGGESSQTGSDGAYEFLDVEDGEYSLKVTKVGYSDLLDDYVITVKNGRRVKRDVQIEKLPPKLTVVDEDGNDVKELDFGENPADVIRSFFIFNKGEDKLIWSIENECAWVSFNKTSGELKPNDPQPLKVTIDRSKLNVGKNTTTFHILTNGGTKQISVFATRVNVIETLPATTIQSNSAVLVGKIIQDMSPSIIEYGFVYSKKAAPTIDNGAVRVSSSNSPSIGTTYNILVSDLDTETWYYARAYAKNGVYVEYGDDVSFLTKEGVPQVKTLGYTNLTSSSVKIQCQVIDDKGSEIKARGVCYSLTPEPDIFGEHTTDGKGVGNWETSLSNLSPNSTYHVRAYATNEYDTGYGEELQITTNDGLADVLTLEVPQSSITSNSASCKCEVVSDGDRQVTERGICWGKTPYPKINGNHIPHESGGVGQYICTMTNLEAGTQYYVCAYAKNSAGTAYGKDIPFTAKVGAPTVQTLAATNVAGNSATLHGRITSTGGAAIKNCGFVCSNGQTIEHLQNVNGEFSTTITGLEPNKSYTYYAFAQNNANEEGKGGSQTIKITAKAPGISNKGASSITSTSAIITGNITSDGGSAVEVCGVCYSASVTRPTPQNATCTEIKNVSTGMFSSTITGLSPKTKYYYNVYAKNAVDFAYGIPANFTTEAGSGSSCSMSVKKSKAPTYNGNEATVYGKITSDCEIIRWGIVVGLSNTSPSLDNYDAIQNNEGAPYSNDVSVTITGISNLTMIYYRFYVVNSQNKVAYSEADYLIVY